ncbi:MAG: zinc-binding dehydrogenase [Clostridia bacterium]|nr:zinc-binding dehydrogenase [Clostridia bacterium]
MKNWNLKDINNVELVESTLKRQDNEIKLKMGKVAISSSDIAYFSTEHENVSVPCHSGVGYVSEADESLGLKMGSRVVVSPFLSYIDHGVKKVNVMGVDVDGLLSDFVCVPSENVYPLPDGISDEEAIFTEFIALSNRVFEVAKYQKGDYIVIVGANTLGLILAQMAIYYQLVPILVDLDADRLKLAEHWGIYYTLNPTFDNLERRVEEITSGRMCEFSIYAGENLPFGNTLRLVKDGGVIIIAGYSSSAKHQLDLGIVLEKELTVKGVNNGVGHISSAINLLANKIVKTDGFISKQIYFDEFPQAVEEIIKYPYQFNKILIKID